MMAVAVVFAILYTIADNNSNNNEHTFHTFIAEQTENVNEFIQN